MARFVLNIAGLVLNMSEYVLKFRYDLTDPIYDWMFPKYD